MSWGSQAGMIKSRKHQGHYNIKYNTDQRDNQNIINGRWHSVSEALRREDIFKQRLQQVTEWFDVWSSAQRCQFFSWFLKRCHNHELEYLQGWFIQRSPVLRQDFTTVLPRELSLYIFSFLDPKSLCRSAGVSWHWRFLVEQDCLWIPKCARYGWFLPYVPIEREYGAWKYHYIECANALDTQTISLQLDFDTDSAIDTLDMDKDAESKLQSLHSNRPVSPPTHYDVIRPPWKVPEKSPRILENDHSLLLKGKLDLTEDFKRNRLLFRRLQSAPSLIKFSRSWKTKALKTSEGNKKVPYDTLLSKTSITSKSLNDIATLNNRYLDTETRFKELNWRQSGIRSARSLRATIYTGNSVPVYVNRNLNTISRSVTGLRGIATTPGHPRVLFLSSRMPSRELLLYCVLYGVIALPYDYEAETLDSLLLKLELSLGPRKALSIGFAIDGNEVDGTLNLIEGVALNTESMQQEKIRSFWKRIFYYTKPSAVETIDIFWPIATTENGLALISEIESITGLKVNCPVGFTGSYNRSETDWLLEYCPEQTLLQIPAKFFNLAKLRMWDYYCKYFQDAFVELQMSLKENIDNFQLDLRSHLVGEMLFKLTKLDDISVVENLSKSIERILDQIWNEEGQYAVRKKVENLQDMLNLEFEAERRTERLPRDLRAFDPDLPTESATESRYSCVQKIIEVEAANVESLKILINIYQKPLLSCLQSNRAIISTPTVRILFSDSETLLKVDEDVLDGLLGRMENWTQNQHIGDVYVKFTTNLKAYCNFLKNYPAILSTLQKHKDENPIFRAFLEGQRLRSDSKGLSISEILLSPTEMLSKRYKLLASLLKCTPVDHEDREHLTLAIEKVREVADAFDEARKRFLNEEKFESLQMRIANCPRLTEPGRTLLKEMHVIQLFLSNQNKEEKSKSEAIYLTLKELVLFLFDDILVVTRKLTRYRPFSRTISTKLIFVSLFTLDSLQVQDIPDSKYLTNSFRLIHGKQKMLCKAATLENKLSYLSILGNRIKIAIPLASAILVDKSRSP